MENQSIFSSLLFTLLFSLPIYFLSPLFTHLFTHSISSPYSLFSISSLFILIPSSSSLFRCSLSTFRQLPSFHLISSIHPSLYLFLLHYTLLSISRHSIQRPREEEASQDGRRLLFLQPLPLPYFPSDFPSLFKPNSYLPLISLCPHIFFSFHIFILSSYYPSNSSRYVCVVKCAKSVSVCVRAKCVCILSSLSFPLFYLTIFEVGESIGMTGKLGNREFSHFAPQIQRKIEMERVVKMNDGDREKRGTNEGERKIKESKKGESEKHSFLSLSLSSCLRI